ncbi:MAG TPA: hypothetical protein VNB92_09070 [Rubrobacter sp.]|nr:hypothetical protein [Rubrobacter sp.]
MGRKGGRLGTTPVLALVIVVLGIALGAGLANAQNGIRAFVTTLGFDEVRFR